MGNLGDRVGEGVEPGGVPNAGVDTASALVQDFAARDPELRASLREVLARQAKLLDLQIEDTREQHDLHLSHLRLRRFGDYAKAAMETAVATFAALLVVGLVAWAWQAHESNGLVVEPLHTPPDFAARGLDGTVLAEKLLDKLNGSVAQADVGALRAPDAIAGNWGEDSKVLIPQTGVSFSEVSRALRQWLGHETRMSGEVVRTATGIALTVRTGANQSATFSGSEADLDKLIGQAAEALLSQTQPYRYAILLTQTGRVDQGLSVLRSLARSGSDKDRAFAYLELGVALGNEGRWTEVFDVEKAALSLDPGSPMAFYYLCDAEGYLSHIGSALAYCRQADQRFSAGAGADLAPGVRASTIGGVRTALADWTGDVSEAIKYDKQLAESRFAFNDTYGLLAVAGDEAFDHDLSSAKGLLSQYGLNDQWSAAHWHQTGGVLPQAMTYVWSEDWKGAVADLDAALRVLLDKHAPSLLTAPWRSWLAQAKARSGDIAGAKAVIETTPPDCYWCLLGRGTIAYLANDYGRADYWFRAAIAQAPEMAIGYNWWGWTLLVRGDYDGAIAKFEQAHEKGPHYADPLEMWGEALMQKNRSDLALAKFEEANEYAPRWGRLHLKWGEALAYLGREEDARAQFRAAGGMDLSATDQATLRGKLSAAHV